MAEIVGSRLEKLIEERRSSQSAVARAIGVSQPSVGRLISGETRESGKLLELARALQTTPEYLVGETDDPDPPGGVNDKQIAFRGPPSEKSDTVEVGQLVMRYGMGETVIEEHVEVERFHFSRAWLRFYTDVSPENLRWIRGVGNSMEPTISDGEPLLVHLGAPMNAADLIWVCAYGDLGMIKRLRPLPDGSIEVLSDNPQVPSFKAYDGELHLIARVLGKMGRL